MIKATIMKKNLGLILFLLFSLVLSAETIDLSVSLPSAPELSPKSFTESGYGVLTAPGMPQLPYKTVNVLLPKGADVNEHQALLSTPRSISSAEPEINQGFSDGTRILTAQRTAAPQTGAIYLGTKNWGDLRYASFRVLPVSYTSGTYQWFETLSVHLDYTHHESNRGNVPGTFKLDDYFVNQSDLGKWYQKNSAKDYDYLIVGTSTQYNAIQTLVLFRQSQGLITSFADIATILQTSPGATDAEKLHNYLVEQYNTNNFSYLLLLGDVDTVPTGMLTPEPDGWETIPSDIYYSDLSSIWDTDNDNRLGEYYTMEGEQDWGVDYTPEVFVGRISSNNPVICTTIANRIVAFEQSNAAWKNKALLPAAYLNYAGEPETIYLQTDGADFMEYEKLNNLRNMQTTTMYEQLGHVPSHPSDFPLDANGFRTQLNTQSWGLINWSAHGSSTTSARKVWMDDPNGNNLPDSDEMQWLDLVSRQSFDNLQNADGTVIFAASCNNGMIDGDQACLGEYTLQKKSVATLAATRTGWYKIGWRNPGWGGLSSYNHHFLENYANYRQSVGMAHAYTNLLHTQIYLFGDPVDSGGIIYPELQNVYTYLLFGDPAIGYTPEAAPTTAQILIWEPIQHNGVALQNAILDAGEYNVVYSDRIIPDYQYLHQFEAVFCLFGTGDTAYILTPGSIEYNALNQYLEQGGSVYMEGWANWDGADLLMSKFGISAPYDHLAYIESLRCEDQIWAYDDLNNVTMALATDSATSVPIFYSQNTEHVNDLIGIWNSNGGYRTIGSSFLLSCVTDSTLTLSDLVSVILDTLGVAETGPVANDDATIPPAVVSLKAYPNPFAGSLNLSLTGETRSPAVIEIFNLRGQLIRRINSADAAKTLEIVWDGKAERGVTAPNGIYLIKAIRGRATTTIKVLLLRED